MNYSIHKYLTLFFVTIISVTSSLSAQDAQNEVKNTFGYLRVWTTNADSFYVILNDDFDNVFEFANNDSLRLKEGDYQLRVIKRYFRDSVSNITINSSKTTVYGLNLIPFSSANQQVFKKFSSYPRIFWGKSILIRTDSDTQIYIDSERVGNGLVGLNNVNKFDVKVIGNEGYTLRTRLTMPESTTFEVVDMYIRPRKKRARSLSILPGASQIYRKERAKGIGIISAQVLTTSISLYSHFSMLDRNRDIDRINRMYARESDPEVVLALGDQGEQLQKESNRFFRIRNTAGLTAGAVYLYNVLDGLLISRYGYRERTFDPYLDFDQGTTSFGIRYNLK